MIRKPEEVTLLQTLRQISECYETALLLYDSGRKGESTVFISRTFEKINQLLNEFKSSNDQKKQDLLEKFVKRCEDDNVWVLDQAENVKKWAENYEQMTSRKVAKLGIQNVLRALPTFIRRLKRYLVKGALPPRRLFGNRTVKTIIFVLAVLIILGAVIGAVLWKNRPICVRQILEEAKVSELRKDGSEIKAAKGYKEWLLGEDSWQKVSRTRMVCGGKERSVIWAHPMQDSVLMIAVDNYDIKKDITGYAGFADVAVVSAEGNGVTAPVEFQIFIDDQLIYETSIARKKGWNNISISDASLDKFRGRKNTLTVKISCADIGFAHFGFDLLSE